MALALALAMASVKRKPTLLSGSVVQGRFLVDYRYLPSRVNLQWKIQQISLVKKVEVSNLI